MAPLTDQNLRAAYASALANRRFEGYVNWSEVAQCWVRKELEGVTPNGVAELMWEHVDGGHEIDQVPERRPEWSQHQFHYDLRLVIGDRQVYIETRLVYTDLSNPDDPTILVANIHWK